jgi:hypothetical protein
MQQQSCGGTGDLHEIFEKARVAAQMNSSSRKRRVDRKRRPSFHAENSYISDGDNTIDTLKIINDIPSARPNSSIIQ